MFRLYNEEHMIGQGYVMAILTFFEKIEYLSEDLNYSYLFHSFVT